MEPSSQDLSVLLPNNFTPLAFFSALVLVASIPFGAAASSTSPILSAASSTAEIQQMILTVAQNDGLNATHFLAVAQCESALDPTIQSTFKKLDGTQERSYGLWQINLDAHPDITLAEADDPTWSTQWAAKQWKNDLYTEWACWQRLFGTDKVYAYSSQ